MTLFRSVTEMEIFGQLGYSYTANEDISSIFRYYSYPGTCLFDSPNHNRIDRFAYTENANNRRDKLAC